MAVIDFQINNTVSKELSQIANKQIPFKIAKSLTQVTQKN
jgi:ribosomal protein S17E